MDTADFIKIWGDKATLAREIGEGETTVRNWFNRGSIPFRYDDKLFEAARARGHVITPTDMHLIRREIAEGAARRSHRKVQPLTSKGAKPVPPVTGGRA